MIKPYNRVLASNYAQKWALSRNPNFFAFDVIGGDCTNFISQCLFAGESVMNFDEYYGWYYKSQHDRAPSWTSVYYLQQFLLSNNQKGPFAIEQPISELLVGDLIQLKQTQTNGFNHTLIISKIIDGKIYVCAHNNDSLNVPLSSYNYILAKGLHIKGIYV